MTNAELATGLLLSLVDRAAGVSALLQNAKAENRDVTSAELDTLVAADDKARDALEKAIISAG